MMKKVFILGAVCLFMLGTTSCSKQPAAATPQPAAKAEPKQLVEAFGTVKSTDIRNVNIDFAAVVSKLNVIEGQRVKNGDVLLSLNTQNYQTQIKSKEYELNTLQVELRGLNRDYTLKQSTLSQNSDPDIRKCLNDKKYAEEAYSKASEDLASKEALLKAGAASKTDVDAFRKTADEKRKAVDDAQLSLENICWKLQRELDALKTSIDQKTSQAAACEHDIKNMKEKLNKSCLKDNDIIADVPNGVVSEVACVQGDIVVATEEGKKILSVINTDTMIVEANVAEEFIKDVKIGAETTILPQADKSHSYKGKVLSIAQKAIQKNNETVIPVRISIENIDSFLLPEFNVDVKISIDAGRQG